MKRLLVRLVPLVLSAGVLAGCTVTPVSQADVESPVDAGVVATAPAAPAPAPTPAPAQEPASEPAPTPSSEPVRPQRLRMGKIDAKIVPIDLTDDGSLRPPDDPSVLGWWGRRAGAEIGTTVLTGHSLRAGGGDFCDLEETPVGTIANVSGVNYRVSSVDILSVAQLSRRAPNLFSQEGPRKLVVVTCEGFNHATGEWDYNVIVTAKPVR